MTEDAAQTNGPVVIAQVWPGFDINRYDAVIEALEYRNQEAEPGGIYHTAADEGGVSVVDVWKSAGRAQDLVEHRLGPVLARLEIPPPPVQHVYPAHNLVIPPGPLNAAPPGAVRVIFDIPGCTADQYDQVIRDLDAAGLTHPAGRILHVAAPTDNGWMVMDIWESAPAFEAITPTLMPFLAKAGVRTDVPPTITALHNTLAQPRQERDADIAAGKYQGPLMQPSTTSMAFTAPVLPGKEQQAEEFFAQIRGPRRAEFDASRRRLGVRERTYRQATPHGTFVIVTLEGDDATGAFAQIAQQNDDFTRWFVRQVAEIHGLDLTQPLPPFPDLIVDTGSEEERNKAVVQQFLDNVLNNHDVSALAPLAGPGYLNYIAVRPEPFALDEVYGPLQMFFDAFPDMRHETKAVVAEGDMVAVQYTINATHSGAFQDIPPTGRPVTINGISLYRVRDGKIVEDYPGFSPLDLLQQIGVIPMPEAAPV
ncbi:MAG TPA: ester cyclase [Chloroflexota bacterium]|nr:ester cyclase [Chloroflexota bacterium]